MRPWLRRLLVILALTLVAAVVAGQIVLWSDLPRRLALDALQRRLGLDVHATRLLVNWRGRTRVENLSVVIPLTGEELIAVPVLTVRHTNLPWLLLSRRLNIHAVRAEYPRLNLTQSTAGQWNIQALIQTTRATDAPETEKRVSLPRLHVRGATVTVTDGSGRGTVLRGVDVTAGAGSGPAWPLELRAAVPDITITGQLVNADDLPHQADFNARAGHDQFPWWTVAAGQTVHVRGQWQGRLTRDGLVGQLDLHEAAIPGTSLSGSVILRTLGDGLQVEPRGLVVRAEAIEGQALRLIGGTARLIGSRVVLDDLGIEALDGVVRLSAEVDLPGPTGRAQAAWSNLRVGPVRHAGSMSIRLQRPHAQRLALSAEFLTRGTSPLGDWETTGKAQAVGSGWRNLRGHLQTGVVGTGSDGLPRSLGDVSLLARLDWPKVNVQSIRTPQPARIDLQASADLLAGEWALEVQGREWRLAGLPELEVEVALRGGPQSIALHEATVRTAQWLAAGVATYDLTDHRLTEARAVVKPTPGSTLAQMVDDAVARFEARGTAVPLDLHVTAAVSARAITARQWRSEAGVDHVLTGRLTRQSLDLDVEDLSLLGGLWRGRLSFLIDEGRAAMSLTSRDVDMQQVGRMLHLPAMSGRADLRLTGRLRELDAQAMTLEAEADLRDVTFGPLRAVSSRAEARLHDGDVRVRLTELAHGDSRAEADVRFNLNRPTMLTASMWARQWPLSWVTADGRVAAGQLTGEAQWDIDTQTRGIRGPVRLSADLALDDRPLGRVGLEGRMAARVLELDRFDADVLDGTVAARGRIDLDNWRQSVVNAACQGLDLSVLPHLRPLPHPLSGVVDGSLVLEPTSEPRALEPHHFTLTLTPTGEAAYGPVTLGPVHLAGFLGPRRLILNEGAASLANGSVAIRGRVTQRDGFQSYDLRLGLTDLDLHQLGSILSDEPRLGRGRLGGELHVMLQGDDPASLGGSGHLTIRDSSMAGNSVFGAVYGAMRLRLAGREPTGEGEMHARMEGGNLVVEDLRYFNQGSDIRMYGQVADVRLGAEAPVNLYVLAALRPLANIPLTQTIDQAMRAFQAGTTTLHVTGTIDQPRAEPVTLKALRQTIGTLLGPVTGQ